MMPIDCHKNDGLVRGILWAWMWIFLICNYQYFFNYEKIQASEKLFKAGQQVAMLYAAPTFHDEVVSSVACTLRDEGYVVVAYIGNGLHVGNIMVPLTGKRQRYSESFYGHCVDKWVTITDPIDEDDIVKDPDLLVYVTYPMLKHNFVHDDQAIQLLKSIKKNDASTNVVLITHRANEAMHETLPIVEMYIPRNRITFLFLGEHTLHTTKEIMESEAHKAETTVIEVGKPIPAAAANSNSYRLSHFYPIMPMEYIGKSRLSGEAMILEYTSQWSSPPAKERSEEGWEVQTFSIQGNFGGKHTHRKDVKGTVNCLKRVESSYEEDTILPEGVLQRTDKPESGKTPLRVNLDLIGHLMEKLALPDLLYGEVRFLSDLSPVDYYKAISRTKFMIAAVGEEDYYTGRATSSVPAALIAGVPLVANKRFLNLYPCLREAKVHKQIATDDECNSIGNAARIGLSTELYQQAKNEVTNCSKKMYEQGRELFRMLGEEVKQRRSANKHTGASAIPHATKGLDQNKK